MNKPKVFECSMRFKRFVIDIVVIMTLMGVATELMNIVQIKGVFFWLLDIVILYISIRIASEVTKKISITKIRWELIFEDDMLRFRYKNRNHEVAIQDILKVEYIEARLYRKITGSDWDKLIVDTNERKDILFLARPDEPKNERKEKELYKIAMVIKEKADLGKEEQQEFSMIETFIRK